MVKLRESTIFKRMTFFSVAASLDVSGLHEGVVHVGDDPP